MSLKTLLKGLLSAVGKGGKAKGGGGGGIEPQVTGYFILSLIKTHPSSATRVLVLGKCHLHSPGEGLLEGYTEHL